MNERTTEVLEQYELEVQSKRRGRGAWICETSQGLKLLREYKGTVKRLEFEEQIMNVLQNQKTCRTDQYMRNREGELLSVAEDGTRCVVKEWFSGRECSVQSKSPMKLHIKKRVVGFLCLLFPIDVNPPWISFLTILQYHYKGSPY